MKLGSHNIPIKAHILSYNKFSSTQGRVKLGKNRIYIDTFFEKGVDINSVLAKFNTALGRAKFVVGQNVGFDWNIMGAEFHRAQTTTPLITIPVLDTYTEVTANLLKLTRSR